jgi:hypothetical protein
VGSTKTGNQHNGNCKKTSSKGCCNSNRQDSRQGSKTCGQTSCEACRQSCPCKEVCQEVITSSGSISHAKEALSGLFFCFVLFAFQRFQKRKKVKGRQSSAFAAVADLFFSKADNSNFRKFRNQLYE